MLISSPDPRRGSASDPSALSPDVASPRSRRSARGPGTRPPHLPVPLRSRRALSPAVADLRRAGSPPHLTGMTLDLTDEETAMPFNEVAFVYSFDLLIAYLGQAAKDDTVTRLMDDLAAAIRRSEEICDEAGENGNQDYIEDLIGTSFVVLQTKIRRVSSHAVSFNEELEAFDLDAIPSFKNQRAVLALGDKYADTGATLIELVCDTGNYFKHRDEWPQGVWGEEAEGEAVPIKIGRRTRKSVERVGIEWNRTAPNMRRAYESLGVMPYSSCAKLAEAVRSIGRGQRRRHPASAAGRAEISLRRNVAPITFTIMPKQICRYLPKCCAGRGRKSVGSAAERSTRSSPTPARWPSDTARQRRCSIGAPARLLPLRQPSNRYGRNRDEAGIAPPLARAHRRQNQSRNARRSLRLRRAIARYRASNAANEQHHPGPGDHH